MLQNCQNIGFRAKVKTVTRPVTILTFALKSIFVAVLDDVLRTTVVYVVVSSAHAHFAFTAAATQVTVKFAPSSKLDIFVLNHNFKKCHQA